MQIVGEALIPYEICCKTQEGSAKKGKNPKENRSLPIGGGCVSLDMKGGE